jgi:hypothetical protein
MSIEDTLDHIHKVQARIEEVRNRLMIRAANHDNSKLIEPELSGYEQLSTKLADVVYGTDEYRAALAEAKPVIAHHYAHNDHHPEHYDNGIAGMSLLSIVEMLAIGRAHRSALSKAASHRAWHTIKSGFGIDDQLALLLKTP